MPWAARALCSFLRRRQCLLWNSLQVITWHNIIFHAAGVSRESPPAFQEGVCLALGGRAVLLMLLPQAGQLGFKRLHLL